MSDMSDIANRLYFVAKNLSIEKALRDLEQYFDDYDFHVSAKWRESSNSSTTRIDIYVFYRGRIISTRTVWISREVSVVDDLSKMLGFCLKYYSLREVSFPVDAGSKKPKVMIDFDEFLGKDETIHALAEAVHSANYPFKSNSYSPF